MGHCSSDSSLGSTLDHLPTKMNMFLATLFFAASVSAEADPYLLGYHGLGYGAGYAGLGYAGYAGYGRLGYAAPYAAGYASVSPSASLTTLGAAPAAIPAVGGAYAGAGRYVANSAGVVHVAKREAEAEADPYVLGYGGYGSYSPSAGVNIAGYAPAALPAVPGAYAGAGRYCANSAGTIHCA